MLRWRIISAIVIVAIFASGCWMDVRYPPAGIGGLWLMPIGAAVCLLGTWEVCRLVFRKITPLHIGMLSVGNLLIFFSAGLPKVLSVLGSNSSLTSLGWPMLLFSLATCVAFGEQMRTYKMGDRAISRLARSVLVLAYAGLLMSFFVALRIFNNNEVGFLALASMIIVVKLSDIGAYTVGRICGGRFSGAARLAPVLSPKKTLEGSVGGILFGCLGSYLSLIWLGKWVVGDSYLPPLWWAWLLYGVLLTIAGMFGDLAESLLKREAGAKDSSRWLPGLGGILDLLDSLLFAAPVAYGLWAIGILGA